MKRYSRYEFFHSREFPFFIDRYIIQKQEVIPSHTHEFFEFVYVEKGSATHILNGTSYTLKSGDLFLLEPGIYHSYSDGLSKETTVYNIMFLPELLKDEFYQLRRHTYFLDFSYLAPFLRNTPSHYPYLNVTGLTKTKVENHLSQMLQEANNKIPGYELMIQTWMLQMLIEIGRYQLEIPVSESKKYSDEHQMHYILSLMHQYYNRPMKISEFSQLCNINPSTLAYKLKTKTGKTYVEYKRSLQLKAACQLLSQTHRTIVDISLETGFQDVSYFYRVFRRDIGCTPLQYREENNQSISF